VHAASQPANRPVTAAKLLAYMQVFFEKCHYFRNDETYRYKNHANVLHMVGSDCVQFFAIVRHRVSEEIGPREINKPSNI